MQHLQKLCLSLRASLRRGSWITSFQRMNSIVHGNNQWRRFESQLPEALKVDTGGTKKAGWWTPDQLPNSWTLNRGSEESSLQNPSQSWSTTSQPKKYLKSLTSSVYRASQCWRKIWPDSRKLCNSDWLREQEVGALQAMSVDWDLSPFLVPI